ncbi:hypothetical protein [Streptomyces sp. NPDC001774]
MSCLPPALPSRPVSRSKAQYDQYPAGPAGPRLLPAEQADPAQVLIQYKGQGAVERRCADFKGPLAVTPVFVQHNRRAAALIQVICLALLVFCLIERQVRRALAGLGQVACG